MVRITKQSGYEAAEQWALRMSRPPDRATADECAAWMLEAPENPKLFVRAVVKRRRRSESLPAPSAEVVTLPERPAPLSARAWRTRGTDTRASPRVQRIAVTIGTGLAALVAAFSFGLLSLPSEARLIEAVGTATAFELEDGTHVDLESGSRLLVSISRDKRQVQLERGAALFQVMRADDRVFWVTFLGGSVETVGTTFRVADTGRRMEVVVYEGRVRVYSKQNQQPVPLSIGATAQVSREGVVTLVQGDAPGAVARDLPVSASLEQIAEVYNARHPDQPLLVDPEVQHERILWRVDEIDRILPVLGSLDRFELVPTSDGIQVKRKTPQGSDAISQTEQ